ADPLGQRGGLLLRPLDGRGERVDLRGARLRVVLGVGQLRAEPLHFGVGVALRLGGLLGAGTEFFDDGEKAVAEGRGRGDPSRDGLPGTARGAATEWWTMRQARSRRGSPSTGGRVRPGQLSSRPATSSSRSARGSA